MSFVSCLDRLPPKGEYVILNNSGCNDGEGVLYFDGTKWDIPECIKSFYVVIGWYEKETN